TFLCSLLLRGYFLRMNSRKTSDVLTDLLEAKKQIVRNYPEGIHPTADSVSDLIKGTAAFGVGPGLKCGKGNGKAWPELFPESPLHIFAHNWGNQRMLKKAQEAGGEADGVFWRRLIDFLERAEFDPANTHTTNVLQGIKSGPAAGNMSSDPTFLSQCLEYLREQVRIVQPRLIVTLGATSACLCRKADQQHRLGVEIITIMHPSTRARNWGGTYEAWVETQAKRLREALK
ncbi:MAG: uracil-DNA glycosylase family protein, partial [Silvibacterium sp.]